MSERGHSGEAARLREQLRVLAQATRRFARACGDYPKLLDTIAETLAELIGDACSVFLVSEDQQSLMLAALRSPYSEYVRAWQPALATPMRLSERPPWQRVVRTGESYLIPKIDPVVLATSSPEHRELVQKTEMHSSLLVALRVNEQSMGLIALVRFRARSPAYDESDRELAQIVADHAAVAIGSARAYAAERVARSAQQLAREREVAETAKLEAESRKQELRFRALIENSADGIGLSDARGCIEYLSPSAAKILGRPAAEVIGTDIRSYLHPDDVDDASAQRRRVLDERGTALPAVRRVIRPDGSCRWIEVTATNMLDDPSVRAIVSNVRDVTDRKLAESALVVAEQRFSALFESGVIGIVIVALDGRVLQANDAFLSMLGYTREELRSGSLNWRTWTPPEWRDVSADAEAQLRREGHTRLLEKEYWRKDGSRAPVLVGAARVDSGEVITFSVDLLDRKRAAAAVANLEAQLRQAQKMEAVGRLAGGVAHDFNNLLSVILSYSEIVLAQLLRDDPLRADVEEIRQAGKRAAELTRQLLMFSRQQVFEPKIIDVNDVLLGMEKMLVRIVGEDVELVSTAAPSLGTVRADAGSIEQVIMNLAVNARDAMPTGGKLQITTANVVLDESYAKEHLGVHAGAYVLISVSDTGSGMDAATQSRIFEPFFTTKEKGKGTGLGLSTVFGIVQRSGGSVWVESALGHGTTFKIYLPLIEAATDPDRMRPEPKTLRGSETVLLVEDEAAVRGVARAILVRGGYHVLVAPLAADALRICDDHSGAIHLLLSDVVMPEMSGPELARRLLARRPSMKVLCMSGYTDDATARHGMEGSTTAFIQKPFTPDTLARKVREVLDA